MTPLLDWGDARHFDHTGNRPCCLCSKPTPMRSHGGEPVHKVCAEDWNAAHPNEARRYTRPGPDRPQGDAGTWRFHNDGPTTDQRLTDLAPETPTGSRLSPVEQEERGLFAA